MTASAMGESSRNIAVSSDSRQSLEELFSELDNDSSGNISKDELIYAMKKMCETRWPRGLPCSRHARRNCLVTFH